MRRTSKTRICLGFIQDVLTCCDLFHYYDGASPLNHQHMEYTPDGLCSAFSSYQHQD